MNDLYISKSNGHFSVFVLPDLATSDTADHPTVLEASFALGFQETTMATYLSHWMSLQSLLLVSHPLKSGMNKGSINIWATFLFSALGDLTQSHSLLFNQ